MLLCNYTNRGVHIHHSLRITVCVKIRDLVGVRVRVKDRVRVRKI